MKYNKGDIVRTLNGTTKLTIVDIKQDTNKRFVNASKQTVAATYIAYVCSWEDGKQSKEFIEDCLEYWPNE